MRRLSLFLSLVCMVLAGCGASITITIPGGDGAVSGADPVSRAAAIPRGYERFLSPAPHAFRTSLPGEPVRRGTRSERFELRGGDCLSPDCENFRYRAEIRETDRATTARVGDDIWYGWSFYNAGIGSVTKDKAIGLVLGQWKLGGERPPAFRLVQTAAGEGNWTTCDPAICNRIGDPADDVVVELEDMRQSYGWGEAQNYGNVCRLFSLGANKGKWVDIVINTNFAADADGYLRIWVNGVLKCNYYGRIVSEATVKAAPGRPNHRRGLFASYTKPWRTAQPDQPIPTMVAYYDEFLSGKERGDVDTAFRESRGLRPKD